GWRERRRIDRDNGGRWGECLGFGEHFGDQHLRGRRGTGHFEFGRRDGEPARAHRCFGMDARIAADGDAEDPACGGDRGDTDDGNGDDGAKARRGAAQRSLGITFRESAAARRSDGAKRNIRHTRLRYPHKSQAPAADEPRAFRKLCGG
ncbi:MAG: hypothetical protein JWL71_5343, partial [Acidobacteria bacterium]|nr:hypothetical protein [Acidobacteriota bacterium]